MKLDADRRTGRTYRAVASAVEAARAGRTVLYVVHNERARNNVMSMLLAHHHVGITAHGPDRVLYGKGAVRVSLGAGASLDEAILGTVDVAVLYDHAWSTGRRFA